MSKTNIIDTLHDVTNGSQALVQIIRALQKEVDDLKKLNGKNLEALSLELMTELRPRTDLNEVTEVGSYWMQDGNSAINKPDEMTNNSIRIVVKAINPNNIQQTIVTAISDQNFTRVYQFSSKTWSKWKLH